MWLCVILKYLKKNAFNLIMFNMDDFPNNLPGSMIQMLDTTQVLLATDRLQDLLKR